MLNFDQLNRTLLYTPAPTASPSGSATPAPTATPASSPTATPASTPSFPLSSFLSVPSLDAGLWYLANNGFAGIAPFVGADMTETSDNLDAYLQANNISFDDYMAGYVPSGQSFTPGSDEYLAELYNMILLPTTFQPVALPVGSTYEQRLDAYETVQIAAFGVATLDEIGGLISADFSGLTLLAIAVSFLFP